MGRDQRVGPAERTQVLGLLGNAYEAGLLPSGDYDARVAAVGTATRESELRSQIADLPAAYTWGPVSEVNPAAGRVALILGIASVPLSVCVIGGILGTLAVIASRNAGRGLGAAMIGRVFGALGIVLSIAAGIAVIYALNHPVSP